MRTVDFLTRQPQNELRDNAFELIARAAEGLRWEDEGAIGELLWQSFTSRDAAKSPNEEEVDRIDRIVRENQLVLDLIDEAIARGKCFVPRVAGLDPSKPPAAVTLSIIIEISSLLSLCYLQVRSFICHRNWDSAVGSISRLVGFGSLLENAWSDFGLVDKCYRGKKLAYRSLIELATHRDVSQTAILSGLSLIEKCGTSNKALLESELGPLLRIVLSFFERQHERAEFATLVRNLVLDNAVRTKLTRSNSASVDEPTRAQVRYPSTDMLSDLDLTGGKPVDWISERCNDPFDEQETMRLLDDAFALNR